MRGCSPHASITRNSAGDMLIIAGSGRSDDGKKTRFVFSTHYCGRFDPVTNGQSARRVDENSP